MVLRVTDLRSARRHDGEPSLSERLAPVLQAAQNGELVLSTEDCAAVMRHLSGVVATLEKSLLVSRERLTRSA